MQPTWAKSPAPYRTPCILLGVIPSKLWAPAGMTQNQNKITNQKTFQRSFPDDNLSGILRTLKRQTIKKKKETEFVLCPIIIKVLWQLEHLMIISKCLRGSRVSWAAEPEDCPAPNGLPSFISEPLPKANKQRKKSHRNKRLTWGLKEPREYSTASTQT